MIDPADLNDPAKAEAFLRDHIEGLTSHIDALEARTAGSGSAVMRGHIEAIKKNRDELAGIVARVEACRKADT